MNDITEFQLKLRASALKKAEEIEAALARLPDAFAMNLVVKDPLSDEKRQLLGQWIGLKPEEEYGESNIGPIWDRLKAEVLRPAIVTMLEVLAARYREIARGDVKIKEPS